MVLNMQNKEDSNFIEIEKLITAYEIVEESFYRQWNIHTLLINMDGKVLSCSNNNNKSIRNKIFTNDRIRAINESLRWGEPSILISSENSSILISGIPIVINAFPFGGIIVEYNIDGDDGTEKLTPSNLRSATNDLLIMAEKANLTNSALLKLNREFAEKEAGKAEAIHQTKDQNYRSIRDLYLIEEPSLIAAIKRGDKPNAIEIINRILVGIYFIGRDRHNLLKSFLLELVVTMSRTAVEAGGDPTELLGNNYSSFAELAKIDNDEDLCKWLVNMLEKMIDAINANKQYPNSVLIVEAINYMQENLNTEISRDLVAEIACLSPSHFSRVIKQTFGQSFTDLLSKFRVDKAKEMLLHTDKSLIQIAYDCGFNDQSYFTKVFQKYASQTPGEYRRSRIAIQKKTLPFL